MFGGHCWGAGAGEGGASDYRVGECPPTRRVCGPASGMPVCSRLPWAGGAGPETLHFWQAPDLTRMTAVRALLTVGRACQTLTQLSVEMQALGDVGGWAAVSLL